MNSNLSKPKEAIKEQYNKDIKKQEISKRALKPTYEELHVHIRFSTAGRKKTRLYGAGLELFGD